jgi:hypothetical protein
VLRRTAEWIGREDGSVISVRVIVGLTPFTRTPWPATTITAFKSWIAWKHRLRFKYRATLGEGA